MIVGRNNRDLRSTSGFTLLEIAIAIFILAGSMVALLSLQSAALDRAVRDKQKQQAMLIARTVLAEIETGLQTTGLGEQSFTARDLLSRHGEGVDMQELKDLKLEQMLINLMISDWEFPVPSASGIPNQIALKRIDLKITWGEGPRDYIEVVYFLPDDEDEEELL